MFNDEQWFSKKASNRIQINSIIIYNDLSPEILKKLGNNLPVTEIVNWIKDTTKEAFKKNIIKFLKLALSIMPSDAGMNLLLLLYYLRLYLILTKRIKNVSLYSLCLIHT